jgi:hypothetical protein
MASISDIKAAAFSFLFDILMKNIEVPPIPINRDTIFAIIDVMISMLFCFTVIVQVSLFAQPEAGGGGSGRNKQGSNPYILCGKGCYGSYHKSGRAEYSLKTEPSAFAFPYFDYSFHKLLL